MLHQILLPLDGSALGERAVPLAATLARAHGAEITVARVVKPPAWAGPEPSDYLSPEVYEELFQAIEQVASDYLVQAEERLTADGLTVHTQLLRGSPAAALLDLETALRPDLVVMSSHGRTGLARFALGSVTDLMVREGIAPVLLVRPFSPALSTLEQALVPLDGSALAEAALPMVEQLAGRPLRRVRLLRAVVGAEDRSTARAYLDRVAARLEPLGLKVDRQVEADAPDRAIGRAAAGMDVVILSTHGRGGLDRLRHGSVAEAATHRLGTPTLLVRAASHKVGDSVTMAPRS